MFDYTTYIPMERGFVYLTAVVDVASRQVLAHKVATTLEACHAAEVLSQALGRYGKPEIVNTDQGSQFTATDFTDVVLQAGCKLVFVERLWRTIKYEHVYKHVYASVADARTLIARHIDWYNTERPHSSLEGQTPNETYHASLPKLAEAA